MHNVPGELYSHICEEASRLHYQLVDVVSKRSRDTLLEIVLDKEGGITLDECGDFNRNLTAWIEENQVLKGNYTLEVCSPGLDREIKSEGEFLWAEGKEVCVTMHEPVDGRSKITGILLKPEEGVLKIEEKNGEVFRVGKDEVAHIRLKVIL